MLRKLLLSLEIWYLCSVCDVSLDMHEEVMVVALASHTVRWTGMSAIDVAVGVIEQLCAWNVSVTWVPSCTRENDWLDFYRRDHATGHFMDVIALRQPA